MESLDLRCNVQNYVHRIVTAGVHNVKTDVINDLLMWVIGGKIWIVYEEST